jgi:hypothetical protein
METEKFTKNSHGLRRKARILGSFAYLTIQLFCFSHWSITILSTPNRRHILIVLALLLAFSAVFTVSAPRAAQAAPAHNVVAALSIHYNRTADTCAPGTLNGSNCNCPSGFIPLPGPSPTCQSVGGPPPPPIPCPSGFTGFEPECIPVVVAPVANTTTGQGVTDVAGTTNQSVGGADCQVYADAALKIPATDGKSPASPVTIKANQQWPQEPTIDPNVDLVSVVGQALYTNASCFNDVRTAVISTDGKTLTIYKGSVAWKKLSAPTGETITSATFSSSGLVVIFNNPNGAKPDTTALIAAATAATKAANATSTAKAAANAATYAAYTAKAPSLTIAAVYAADATVAATNPVYATNGTTAADATAAVYAATAAKAAQDFVTAWQNNITPTVTYSIDQINAWSNATDVNDVSSRIEIK